MPNVFFSYCHADEALRDQLEIQLALLKRQGTIETWHDRRIGAGQELVGAIDAQLESADIILLLVSPDFLASDYCYDIEMNRAMERHADGKAIVVPVILRPCMWHDAPFGRLMATPKDGKPVIQFPNLDAAFLEVAQAIKAAAKRLSPSGASAPEPVAAASPGKVGEWAVMGTQVIHRSSNLRLAKEFTDRDKDRFKHETFDYIASYFANSLDELTQRNPGVDGDVRRVDSNRFTASIYRQGKAIARCTVFIGDGFLGDGIAYANGETGASNSCNETLRVQADDQMLYLTPMGFGMIGRHGDQEAKLSQEGAAELYWSMLIEPVQRGDR